MARYTTEEEEIIKEEVRHIVAFNSTMSAPKVLIELEKSFNKTFDRGFIIKLKREIAVERVKEMKNSNLEEEVAHFHDVVQSCVRELIKIYKDPCSKPVTKTMVIKAVLDANRDLLNVKFDAGIFKKSLGELDLKYDDKEMKERLGDIFDALKDKGVDVDNIIQNGKSETK